MNTIQTAASMSNAGSNAGSATTNNSDPSSLSHNQPIVASTKIVADPLTYEKSIYKKSMPLHMGVGPVPEISVVVPVYNEEENVELLYQKLVSALDQLGRTWEAILIDDGSKDQS